MPRKTHSDWLGLLFADQAHPGHCRSINIKMCKEGKRTERGASPSLQTQSGMINCKKDQPPKGLCKELEALTKFQKEKLHGAVEIIPILNHKVGAPHLGRTSGHTDAAVELSSFYSSGASKLSADTPSCIRKHVPQCRSCRGEAGWSLWKYQTLHFGVISKQILKA